MENDDSTDLVLDSKSSVVNYIKDGGGWDVAVSTWAMSHGVPIPPPIVARVRVGLGRLIDGGFDLAVGLTKRINNKWDFDSDQQMETVRALADVGRSQLAKDVPLAEAVARSLLNEHKLKFQNRVNVSQVAMDELSKAPPLVDEGNGAELEVDWLNHFAEIAGKKSAPEMQLLLGRILAGEIRRPGSFSPMSMNILANMTTVVAKKFEALCSLSVRIQGVNYILVDVFPKFTIQGIPEIGFEYQDVLLLRQYQLLAAENGTSFTLPNGHGQIMSKDSENYLISPLSGAPDGATERRISVSPFTTVGDEILTLLRPETPQWLVSKIFDTYKAPQWAMRKL